MKLSFDRITSGLFREFRNVINKVIGDAESNFKETTTRLSNVENTSNEALDKAEDAQEKAEDALTTSDSLQTQLNDLIVHDGTSDAETVQARTSIDGVASATLKESKDRDFLRAKGYREKQTSLYGQFFRKLRLKQAVKITMQGDSLTYGYDINSTDKRPPDPTVLPDGSTHTRERASKTMPEALSEFLKGIYGDANITVYNRGYSGDGVKQGYNRWITSSNSNMTVICYGTNDSRESSTGYPGDIDEFLKWYRKVIERELDRNAAVMILTPPKNRYDINPDTYESALLLLGDEYGIPVIKCDEMFAGYGPELNSDGTHFNGTGYTTWATRIAALFIGEGPKVPKRVSGGASILSREYVDNIVYTGSAYMRSNAGYPTPSEVEAGQGVAAFLASDGKATWSFYLEEGDTVLLPTLYNNEAGAKVKLTLDFGVTQPDVSSDYLYGYTGVNNTTLPSFAEWVNPTNLPLNNTVTSPYLYTWDQPRLTIVGKGWHTITAEFTGTTTAAVQALTFFPYLDLFRAKDNQSRIGTLEKKAGYLKVKTHANYTDTATVTSTSVKLQDVLTALGYPTLSSYWENPPLKVTVYNWDHNILEYVITISSTSQPTQFKLGLDSKETKIIASPNATYVRTLSSISYDQATDNLTFNWSGATNRATEFVIKLL